MTPDKETTGEASKTPIVTALLSMARCYQDDDRWDDFDRETCRQAADQLTAAQAVMEQMAEALKVAEWEIRFGPATKHRLVVRALAAYKALTPQETKL